MDILNIFCQYVSSVYAGLDFRQYFGRLNYPNLKDYCCLDCILLRVLFIDKQLPLIFQIMKLSYSLQYVRNQLN